MIFVILDLLGSGVEYDYILRNWVLGDTCYIALGSRKHVLFNL